MEANRLFIQLIESAIFSTFFKWYKNIWYYCRHRSIWLVCMPNMDMEKRRLLQEYFIKLFQCVVDVIYAKLLCRLEDICSSWKAGLHICSKYFHKLDMQSSFRFFCKKVCCEILYKTVELLLLMYIQNYYAEKRRLCSLWTIITNMLK